jgi:hypothetical protein
VGGNLLLEVEDLDDLFSRMATQANQLSHSPRVFPETDIARRQLLEHLEADEACFETVMFGVLAAISLEKNALKSIAFITNPPPELNLAPFKDFKDASYLRHCTADEIRMAFFAMKRLWDRVKESRNFRAGFFPIWKSLPGILDNPAKAAEHKITKTQRLRAIKLLRPISTAAKDNPVVWDISGLALIRFYGIDDLRIILECIRDVFRTIDGIANRLRAVLGVASRDDPVDVEESDKESSPLTYDGLLPPKYFQWSGVRYTIPGVRWKMLNHLWQRRTMPDVELGMALWGEEWDETKLSTTVNRLNNDLHKTPWQIKRKDGTAILSKRATASHKS